jgi:hypothetical protein
LLQILVVAAGVCLPATSFGNVYFVNDLINKIWLTEFDIAVWQVFHVDSQIIGDTALILHIKSSLSSLIT